MTRQISVRFVIITLLIVALACNTPFGLGEVFQGGTDEEEGALGPGVLPNPEELEPGSLFILVVDPDGDPVPFAQVGDSGLTTDWYGVAAGPVSTKSGGWFPVRASGFATTYTRALTVVNGYPIALTILTPLGTSRMIERGTSESLDVESQLGERAQVIAESGTFGDQDVLLSWSNVPITQLDTRFGGSTGLGEKYLNGAFALEAMNLDGQSVDIVETGELTLQITWDPERGEIPTIGHFNPDLGEWESFEGQCSFEEHDTMRCSLPHLSEFGLFGSSSSGSGWTDDAGGSFSNGFGSALDNAMGSGSAEGGDAGSSDGGTAGGLSGLSGSSDGLGSEVDKMTALLAYGMALENGQTDLANQFLDEARDLTEDLADEMLEDESCGKPVELLNLAAQAMLVGGLEGIANQLIDKAADALTECVNWVGPIKHWYFFKEDWPGKPFWKFEKGTGSWIETTNIFMAIDPKTGAIDGEAHVKLAFSTATYRRIEHSTCGEVHNDQDVDTHPGYGSAVLLFEGTYDGNTFAIGSLEINQQSPLTLAHHAWLSQSYPLVPPPKCPGPTTDEISYREIAEYTSQLIHGFFGKPEPPSIQDMLNTGARGKSSDGQEWIRGSQDLSYSPGVNLTPLLPIKSGSVTWEFVSIPQER
jgi:hypothetical protein